jgi:hypothetical protein
MPDHTQLEQFVRSLDTEDAVILVNFLCTLRNSRATRAVTGQKETRFSAGLAQIGNNCWWNALLAVIFAILAEDAQVPPPDTAVTRASLQQIRDPTNEEPLYMHFDGI